MASVSATVQSATSDASLESVLGTLVASTTIAPSVSMRAVKPSFSQGRPPAGTSPAASSRPPDTGCFSTGHAARSSVEAGFTLMWVTAWLREA